MNASLRRLTALAVGACVAAGALAASAGAFAGAAVGHVPLVPGIEAGAPNAAEPHASVSAPGPAFARPASGPTGGAAGISTVATAGIPQGRGTGSGAPGGPAPAGPALDAPAPPPPTDPAAFDAPVAVSLETPGRTERVSVDSQGAQIAAQSTDPAISDDGNLVVFGVTLVVNNQTATAIVLRDRGTGTTRVIYPTASAPVLDRALFVQARLSVSKPDISGDGQWIAFEATNGKTNLVAMWNKDRGLFDPFGDAKLGFTYAASPKLSADGRYLAFIGQPAATAAAVAPHYYVLDRQTSRLSLVGFDHTGEVLTANQYLGDIDISGDGAYVAYSDQPVGTESFQREVWRRKVAFEGPGTLLSANRNGDPAGADSSAPALNADGSVVAFQSDADNLVAGDTNRRTDIFLWSAGGLRRASLRVDGGQANGDSQDPALNAAGTMVTWASWATNLVPKDSTGPVPVGADRSPDYDIFVLDTTLTRLARVNVGVGTTEANGTSLTPQLSASGRQIAFASAATNLVDKDTNDYGDVFVRARLPAFKVATDPTDFGSTAVGSLPGAVRTATVTSIGSWPVQITTVQLGGAGAGAYLVTNNLCAGRSLAPGATCTIQITFIPAAKGTAAATLSVSAGTIKQARTIRLTGKGGVGTIKVNPTLGPPGFVTQVTGSGFGAFLPVTLTWSRGITAQLLAPVMTDKSGNFVAQMLVIPRDQIGPRTLEVTVAVATGTSLKATAKYLVTTPSGVPPVFGLVQMFRDPFGRPIILRR